MSAREDILGRVRRHADGDVDLPGDESDWIVYPDPRKQFADVLASVGGKCVVVPDASAANVYLQSVAEYATAGKRCSLVAGVGSSSFDLTAVADPHELHDVDFAVLPGELAVAENGAVWVTDDGLAQRVLHFLPQHLAIVVQAAQVVHNLHEAYERIAVERTPFGAFVSGPSKTADIEQALVIGAHGARSLTVLLVENM